MSLTRPTVTGYSGLFSDTLGAQDVGTYTMLPLANGGNRSGFEPKIARIFKGEQMRELKAALAATIGAVAGGTAATTYKRVVSPAGPSATVPVAMQLDALGGDRTMETITPINRVTTAADVTYLKQLFSGRLTASNITYPTDASTNENQGPARF